MSSCRDAGNPVQFRSDAFSIDMSLIFSLSTQARTIFEKATKVNYKQVDDLAAVWCEYGEMELRHENYEQALRILRVRHLYFICSHYYKCSQ